MPDLRELAEQLSGLVALAGCAAMATPIPKPKSVLRATVLPATVEPANPTRKPRKQSNLSPEVREFMQLPPNIQRQVLDYARNWIDASFERGD